MLRLPDWRCKHCSKVLSVCRVNDSQQQSEYYWFCPACNRRIGEPITTVKIKNRGIDIEVIPLTSDSAIFTQLRNMPYGEYLNTEHWANMRKSALIQARNRCQLCNSDQNLEVHHRTYERRGNEDIADLTVLCCGCHEKFHDVLRIAEVTPLQDVPTSIMNKHVVDLDKKPARNKYQQLLDEARKEMELT